MKRKFNDTGVCVPHRHYMVDVSGKLEKISQLVEGGEYFTINRPRQFGKTTIILLLDKILNLRYVIELKIWYGSKRHEASLKQSSNYLDIYPLKKG